MEKPNLPLHPMFCLINATENLGCLHHQPAIKDLNAVRAAYSKGTATSCTAAAAATLEQYVAKKCAVLSGLAIHLGGFWSKYRLKTA